MTYMISPRKFTSKKEAMGFLKAVSRTPEAQHAYRRFSRLSSMPKYDEEYEYKLIHASYDLQDEIKFWMRGSEALEVAIRAIDFVVEDTQEKMAAMKPEEVEIEEDEEQDL